MKKLPFLFQLLPVLIFLEGCTKSTPLTGEIHFSTTNVFSVSFDYTASTNTYNWDFGDNNFSTVSNPTHQYKYTGLYHIKLNTDNRIVEKDLLISPPDSMKITSFIIRSMSFEPAYVDTNQAYNIYWMLINDSTGEAYSSTVKPNILPSNLPLIWNNINLTIPLNNTNRYKMKAAYYKSSDNSFTVPPRAYSLIFSNFLSTFGYSDTLNITTSGSDLRFDIVNKWIIK